MNHKKSMRIFWISFSLLLIAGLLLIAAAQYRLNQKQADHAKQPQTDGQAADFSQSDTKAEEESEDTAALFAAQPSAQAQRNRADAKMQPASGNTAEYRFELKVKDGYLDVYHFHTDNLFFHTGIPYQVMTVEQRQELEAGKYFINEQELYGYLESCTS